MSRYFIPDSWYFITVPTDHHRPIFKDIIAREILRLRLVEAFVRFNVEYPDYGIMEDHYHFLGSFGRSGDIPKLLQWVNGGVAYALGKKFNVPSPVWGNYHVFVPMKEDLLDRVRGYVIGNPLKHGDIKDFRSLYLWPFCTYRRVVDEEGEGYAKDIVTSVIDFDDDEFFETLPTTRTQQFTGRD